MCISAMHAYDLRGGGLHLLRRCGRRQATGRQARWLLQQAVVALKAERVVRAAGESMGGAAGVAKLRAAGSHAEHRSAPRSTARQRMCGAHGIRCLSWQTACLCDPCSGL
jgi:hypothetical protein